MRAFINKLIPFVFLGIAIVAFAFGIVLLAYLFIFGALIGFILYLFYWIKHKFFPPKIQRIDRRTKKPKSDRIIDSDYWKHDKMP